MLAALAKRGAPDVTVRNVATPDDIHHDRHGGRVTHGSPASTTAKASLVPERMIIAPSVGVFRPLDDVDAGDLVDAGQTVGAPRRPRHLHPGRAARSAGGSSGMLAHRGERLREGQPVAWLRVA